MRSFSLKSILALILIVSVSLAQQNWACRNPLPTGETIRGGLYANGEYLVHGDAGNLFSSSDLITWEKVQTYTDANGYSLHLFAYGKGKLVAISGYSDILVHESNGSWQKCEIRGNETTDTIRLTTLGFGNNTFVAAGKKIKNDSVVVCYSTDGAIWKLVPLGATTYRYYPRSIASNESSFVICGDSLIAWSNDAKTWSVKSYDNHDFRNILWDGDRFLALGIDSKDYSETYVVTEDTLQVTHRFDDYYGARGLAWNGKKYVTLTDDTVLTSTDGINWDAAPLSLFDVVNVFTVGDTFVAVGENGTIGTSTNGVTWDCKTKSLFSSNRHVFLTKVAYANKIFCASGYQGAEDFLLTSKDGITWNKHNVDSFPGAFFSCNNKTYLVARNKYYVSNDIKKWEQGFFTQDTTFGLRGMADDGKKYVAVGNTTKRKTPYSTTRYWKICFSSDGQHWSECKIDTVEGFVSGICYGNGKFIAVGQKELGINTTIGLVATSSDGVNWTEKTVQGSQRLYNPCWGNNEFIAIDIDIYSRPTGMIFKSKDGLSWSSAQITPYDLNFYEVIWVNNQYVSCAYQPGWFSYSQIYTSPDAITWTKQSTNCSKGLTSLAYGSNKIVAVGEEGTIITSDVPNTVVKNQKAFRPASSSITMNGSLVSYTLSSSRPTTLRLFDIRGRLVQTLVNSTQQSGQHMVSLPRHLASGSYILSLRAGDQKVDKVVPIGFGRR